MATYFKVTATICTKSEINPTLHNTLQGPKTESGQHKQKDTK